jgi:hypothetical protein
MGWAEKRDWKQRTWKGRSPSDMDWARLAAYIDGEGSVLINPRRGRIGEYKDIACTFYLKVTVANTDVRLMAWIKERFGGSYKDANTKSYYAGRNCKTSWHWAASSGDAAWILFNCMSYFVIKAEQAEIGIRLQESIGRRVGKFLPKEVIESRREMKRQLLVLKARGRDFDASEQRQHEEVA